MSKRAKAQPMTIQEMTSKGGKARAAKMSPAERAESARIASVARWGGLSDEEKKTERAKGRKKKPAPRKSRKQKASELS